MTQDDLKQIYSPFTVICPRCRQMEVLDIVIYDDHNWLVAAVCVKDNKARILGSSAKNLLAAMWG